MSETAVEIKSVEFSYKQDRPLLRIDSFTLKKGQHCFVKGASGSGKSTFLGLLAGMLKPQKGQISIGGHNILQMKARELDSFRGRSIGYLAQMFNLIPYLSAFENICLPLALHRHKLDDQRRTALHELIQSLDIGPFLYQKARELSVGQQQRVAAARSFVCDPELVIADEPTSSLDERQKEKLMRSLMEMATRRSCTLIVASHDRDVAALFPHSFDPGGTSCLQR